MSCRIPTSSTLDRIDYDLFAQFLEVRFRDGRVVRWSRVPSTVHDALVASASPEAFLRERVEDRYPTRTVKAAVTDATSRGSARSTDPVPADAR